MESLKENIKKIARDCMLDEIRFIDAGDIEPLSTYRGRQPKDFMEEAKSIIVASIYIGGFFFDEWKIKEYPKTSRLTLSGFYFNVVEPLKPICDYLLSQGYKAIICDGFSEEASIPLKPAGVKAGLGWIGKNTLLLNEKYGSWQALGAIITDADIAEVNKGAENRCGSCNACMRACPMQAIENPCQLKRKECLSDLLEEETVTDDALAKNPGYFVECDICQLACPWNAEHLIHPLETPRSMTFDKKEAFKLFRSDFLAGVDEASYNEKIIPYLSGIDLPYDRFRRNLKTDKELGR